MAHPDQRHNIQSGLMFWGWFGACVATRELHARERVHVNHHPPPTTHHHNNRSETLERNTERSSYYVWGWAKHFHSCEQTILETVTRSLSWEKISKNKRRCVGKGWDYRSKQKKWHTLHIWNLSHHNHNTQVNSRTEDKKSEHKPCKLRWRRYRSPKRSPNNVYNTRTLAIDGNIDIRMIVCKVVHGNDMLATQPMDVRMLIWATQQQAHVNSGPRLHTAVVTASEEWTNLTDQRQ